MSGLTTYPADAICLYLLSFHSADGRIVTKTVSLGRRVDTDSGAIRQGKEGAAEERSLTTFFFLLSLFPSHRLGSMQEVPQGDEEGKEKKEEEKSL